MNLKWQRGKTKIMAVVLKCGAVFLHIPKTGGSWVTQVLKDQGLVRKNLGHIHGDYVRCVTYGGSPRLASQAIYDWGKSLVPRKFKAAKAVQAVKHARIAAQQAPFTFCFVRHPLDWYASFWRYMGQRDNPHWASEPDLHGWHPCRPIAHAGHPEFNEYIRRIIASRPGFVTELYSQFAAPEISFVGRQENLASDLVAALEQLNVTFDEDRIRQAKLVNRSPRDGASTEWEPNLREEMMRIEYPALLRYGYAEPNLSVPGTATSSQET